MDSKYNFCPLNSILLLSLNCFIDVHEQWWLFTVYKLQYNHQDSVAIIILRAKFYFPVLNYWFGKEKSHSRIYSPRNPQRRRAWRLGESQEPTTQCSWVAETQLLEQSLLPPRIQVSRKMESWAGFEKQAQLLSCRTLVF